MISYLSQHDRKLENGKLQIYLPGCTFTVESVDVQGFHCKILDVQNVFLRKLETLDSCLRNKCRSQIMPEDISRRSAPNNLGPHGLKTNFQHKHIENV